MQLTDRIAVTILAATDAVFVPDRDPCARPRHQVIYERRHAFLWTGIPWASERVEPGLDDTGRKQVQRALERLVADGLAVSFRPKGAKTLGARLTEKGDAYARSTVGLPTFCDVQPRLEELERWAGSPGAGLFLGMAWVPETVLTGIEWGDNEKRQAYVQLEEKLLPALCRGLVISNCSIHGHCWYSINPKWRELLPATGSYGRVPDTIEVARFEYYGRLRTEIQAIASATPENDREIGEIPMPVCPPRKKAG